MTRLLAVLLVAFAAFAHEGNRRNAKPTAAAPQLKQVRRQLNQIKKAAPHACCVKPGCDLCLLRKGKCTCAEDVKAGRGGCGECQAGWTAGRGAVPGVKSSDVDLLPAGPGELSPELRAIAADLLAAKRTLVKEKRFQCCIRGGCTQCAFEGECTCGTDLAQAKPKGVCGDCLHGWRAGEGLFAGINSASVTLSPMNDAMAGMTPGPAESGVYFASGTAQLPSAQPFGMLTKRSHGWNLMFSGVLFGVHTNNSGPRGRDKLFATGWVMPMASRRLGRGVFSVRTMFSPEALTVTNGRYPLLFQEGETWKNIPIINGQHPHDFVKELAVGYQYRLGEQTSLNLYYGLRGDPAIGPVAYPHRASQSENPLAVLAHHYQDSTHIASNVATVGVSHRWLTLEASGFHGREPDEKRWGIELGPINSFASRVTLTPSSRWAGQFSLARINNREATHPDRDSWRQTASVQYIRPLATGHWAWSAVWGRNHDLSFTQLPGAYLLPATAKPNAQRQHLVLVPTRVPGYRYNAYTLESTLLTHRRHWIWGRAELTDRSSLLLFEEAPFVALIEEQRFTRVKAYTMGYSFELPSRVSFLQHSLGAQFQLLQAPANLQPIYGAYPKGFQILLRVRFRAAEATP
jgi:hypothetical protein